jgi:hypothetical protein
LGWIRKQPHERERAREREREIERMGGIGGGGGGGGGEGGVKQFPSYRVGWIREQPLNVSGHLHQVLGQVAELRDSPVACHRVVVFEVAWPAIVECCRWCGAGGMVEWKRKISLARRRSATD